LRQAREISGGHLGQQVGPAGAVDAIEDEGFGRRIIGHFCSSDGCRLKELTTDYENGLNGSGSWIEAGKVLTTDYENGLNGSWSWIEAGKALTTDYENGLNGLES
jgi:hypothetical protein